MSEYLGSAFRSFVGNRKVSNGLPKAAINQGDPQQIPLPFDPLPIPEPVSSAGLGASRPQEQSAPDRVRQSQKMFRHSAVPTVRIPENPAPASLISPVSVVTHSTPSPALAYGANPRFSGQPTIGKPPLSEAKQIPCALTMNSHVRQSQLHRPALSPPASMACIATSADEDLVSNRKSNQQPLQRSFERVTPVNGGDENPHSYMVPCAPHPDIPTNLPESPGTSDIHTCNHCDSRFRNRESMVEHVKTTHLRPFVCTIAGCSANFSKQNHLSRHVRIVHNKERPFACPEPGCGSRFGSKSHLGDHTRAVHMRVRDFKCNICDASWSKRFNLEKHIKIRHLGEKPFKCRTCKLPFGTRSHVTRHEQKVHKQGGSSQVQKK